MNDDTLPGHTDQSGRIIEMMNSAQPMFFSEKVGRDNGSPAGGWSKDRDDATVMDESQATRLLETSLLSVAPFCQVVAK